VRGLRRLQSAQVVVHDSLVGKDLLALSAPDAELVCVGKRCGAHGAAQEEINALLVEKARAGLRVARLKGGDPLLFGRGGEELFALAAAGIACEIIPGVTAALASGASAQIPLTHRALASGALFVTGHESRAGRARVEWERLGALRGLTLCVYMGVKNLPDIARRLIAGGLPPGTPLAVVSQATLPGEQVFASTAAQVAAGAVPADIPAPALAIVGGVAGNRVGVNREL
jgi:uroporphyrin-III C-methyltransferase